MLRASPILYAHRGAAFELPENTLEAFELALELGADAIETDAHMTRDGRVVLSHDPTGATMAGVARLIADATLAEVEQWDVATNFVPRGRDGRKKRPYRIPTLEEALARFPGVVFNVDAKQERPDMIPALLRAVRSAGATDRVRLASFSYRNLARVRSLGYEGETGLSSAEVMRAVLLPLPLAHVAGNAAQIPVRARGMTLASPRVIDRLHQLGLRVDFWTIDDPDEASRLFAMGADGVMTEDVRKLARALKG